MNMTQHPATQEQFLDGVFDLPAEWRETISTLLTVDDFPHRSARQTVEENILERCRQLADIADRLADGVKIIMIGGAPFMMAPLEQALTLKQFRVFYAFSRRESSETKQPDGSIQKVSVFRHEGFIEGIAFYPRGEERLY